MAHVKTDLLKFKTRLENFKRNLWLWPCDPKRLAVRGKRRSKGFYRENAPTKTTARVWCCNSCSKPTNGSSKLFECSLVPKIARSRITNSCSGMTFVRAGCETDFSRFDLLMQKVFIRFFSFQAELADIVGAYKKLTSKALIKDVEAKFSDNIKKLILPKLKKGACSLLVFNVILCFVLFCVELGFGSRSITSGFFHLFNFSEPGTERKG